LKIRYKDKILKPVHAFCTFILNQTKKTHGKKPIDMALRMATVKTVGQQRNFMNIITNKRPSSEAMGLWLVSAIMILSVIVTPAHDAQKNTTPANTPATIPRAMIPSLFPDELLAFEPEKVLIGDQDYDATNLYYPIIVKAAIRHKVSSAMVKAIISVESDYNHFAISIKGAMGLMQLMPDTAKELGVENSFNPVQNIYAGVGYFKNLLERFNGNVQLALAAYNAGIGAVLKYRGVPPFKDTRHYIKKVLHYHQHYMQQAKNSIVKAGVSKS
jgi:soluble lytic murein transglycosylase-like protein